MEEKRALLERCATAEEQLEATIVEMKQIVKKYEENSKAVQELGEQNQTLQIRLDEANNKLRRSWTDDRMVDKCQNDKCQKLFTTVIRKVIIIFYYFFLLNFKNFFFFGFFLLLL